jgi:hypothetical protein
VGTKHLTLDLKKKTKSLRHGVALGTLQLLAPKLKIDMENGLKCITAVPRPFTRFLKEVFGVKPLVGVEVGFGFGYNAESLLSELNIKRLYCVEPYIKQTYIEEGVELGYVKGSLYDSLVLKNNVTFINLKSDEAFKILDYGVDFVYIDGCHLFEQVKKDIFNSFKIVKTGGYVGGHDFTRGCQNGVIPAVINAALFFKQVPTIKIPDFWFKKEMN